MKKTMAFAGSSEPLLDAKKLQALVKSLAHWQLINSDGIEKVQRVFQFTDFAAAMAFAQAVAKLADKADHHPEITIRWGSATVTWWTHRVQGLHQIDVTMAMQTDDLYQT